jgi:hypothetical protein
MIWGLISPALGEEGRSRRRVGRPPLMLVVVVVVRVCVFFGFRTIPILYCRGIASTPPHGEFSPYFKARQVTILPLPGHRAHIVMH